MQRRKAAVDFDMVDVIQGDATEINETGIGGIEQLAAKRNVAAARYNPRRAITADIGAARD